MMRVTLVVLFICSWIFNLGGCSTTEVVPIPVPPIYLKAPHPQGTGLGDLAAIFLSPDAPKEGDFVKTCDADFRKLSLITNSKDELSEGIRELVRQDPVQYHWCFYGKLQTLEEEMKTDPYVVERQKKVLTTFEFLVPVARSFASEFHDSRYLRWAVSRYRKLSEFVFFRKLELTPAGTSELVQTSNPFGFWRDDTKGTSVIEKYHFVKSPNPSSDAVPNPAPNPPMAEVSVPVAASPATPTSSPQSVPAVKPPPAAETATTAPSSSVAPVTDTASPPLTAPLAAPNTSPPQDALASPVSGSTK